MMERGLSVPCVELRNVVKRFPGVTAVDHLSLTVDQGKVFTLLGPSGCGKTTTLRLVAGLEKLDEGEVLIDGRVMNDFPPNKRNCSTVFQTLALFPHLTVEQNIGYGLERRRLPKGEIKKRVGDVLELVELNGLERRYPNQISGGQRQRVALARSLVLKPKILLLDEPLSSLDRKLRKDMQLELKRVQREVGITFLYVTHDQKVALSISDVIAVMNQGNLVQIGSPDEIYENPRTRFVADFMGASNIFPARVTGGRGRKMQLAAEGGLQVFAVSNRDIRAGDVYGVSIHPESVEISFDTAAMKDENSFVGRIVEKIYQGDFIEVKVDLKHVDASITAHLSNRMSKLRNVGPGDTVVVHWEARNSNILTGR